VNEISVVANHEVYRVLEYEVIWVYIDILVVAVRMLSKVKTLLL